MKQMPYLILASLLCFNIIDLPAKEEKITGNTGPESNASDMKSCINLSGTYSLYGEGLPGKPSRFRGAKFALDEVLGVDLARGEKERVIYVELIQHGQEAIDLNFWDQTGVLSKKLVTSAEHKFFCNTRELIIEQSVTTKGEAVSGQAQITHVLSLTNDGSLLIKMNIHRNSRSFIFGYDGKEEYWVQFNFIKLAE